MPEFIRGPFSPVFDAVSKALARGDKAAALAAIDYAVIPESFDPYQAAALTAAQDGFRSAIDEIG